MREQKNETRPSIDSETAKKIQELQILDQNLQNFILQRQAFQFDLNETVTALEELSKAKDDVYKIIGQVMLKTKKEELKKELEEKKELMNLRLKSLEKQEQLTREKLLKLRDEILKTVK